MGYINTKVYPKLKALELIETAIIIQRETGTDTKDIIIITTNAPREAWANKVIDDSIHDDTITPCEAANNIYKEICAR